MAYNRYKSFISGDGSMKEVPFIKIPNKTTDKFTYWDKYNSRMDILSYRYYGDPSYGWLILQANPTLPSMEYMIDNGEKIRIPFPLDVTISRYEDDIKLYYQINKDVW